MTRPNYLSRSPRDGSDSKGQALSWTGRGYTVSRWGRVYVAVLAVAACLVAGGFYLMMRQ